MSDTKTAVEALSGAIINLPCSVPVSCANEAEKLFYVQGHREAREAAADLVAASVAPSCSICGEDDPYTGTCGSTDPRALCNRIVGTSTGSAESGSTVEPTANSHLVRKIKDQAQSMIAEHSSQSAAFPAKTWDAVALAIDEAEKNGVDSVPTHILRVILARTRSDLPNVAHESISTSQPVTKPLEDGYVLALQTVVEMPGGKKELGYTLLDGVGVFTDHQEVSNAIAALSLPLGWVSMKTSQLLPGWMTPEAHPKTTEAR